MFGCGTSTRTRRGYRFGCTIDRFGPVFRFANAGGAVPDTVVETKYTVRPLTCNGIEKTMCLLAETQQRLSPRDDVPPSALRVLLGELPGRPASIHRAGSVDMALRMKPKVKRRRDATPVAESDAFDNGHSFNRIGFGREGVLVRNRIAAYITKSMHPFIGNAFICHQRKNFAEMKALFKYLALPVGKLSNIVLNHRLRSL